MPRAKETRYELLPRFEQLEAFLDTIKYGGSLAAAKARKIKNKAYIAQTNARLQRDLGVLLFYPHTSNLTPAGEAFAKHAKKLLAARKRMLTEMKKMADENRLQKSVHLVAPTWIVEDLSMRKILGIAYPEYHVSNSTECATDYDAWSQYKKLAERKQDPILLTADTPKNHVGFDTVLRKIDLIPVISKQHIVWGDPYSLIGYSEYSKTQESLSKAFADCGPHRIGTKWKHFVSTPFEAASACAGGAGVAFIPKFYLDIFAHSLQSFILLEHFRPTLDILLVS